jgi:hypothetical protein
MTDPSYQFECSTVSMACAVSSSDLLIARRQTWRSIWTPRRPSGLPGVLHSRGLLAVPPPWAADRSGIRS